MAPPDSACAASPAASAPPPAASSARASFTSATDWSSCSKAFCSFSMSLTSRGAFGRRPQMRETLMHDLAAVSEHRRLDQLVILLDGKLLRRLVDHRLEEG